MTPWRSHEVPREGWFLTKLANVLGNTGKCNSTLSQRSSLSALPLEWEHPHWFYIVTPPRTFRLSLFPKQNECITSEPHVFLLYHQEEDLESPHPEPLGERGGLSFKASSSNSWIMCPHLNWLITVVRALLMNCADCIIPIRTHP